jgi:sec-independent protein translocase protein TatC
MMPVVFGLSFQTPLIMLFGYKVGFFSISGFRGKRRMIWFVMAIFAAIITPSTDPASMMFLWVPMCLLFELGIYLCVVTGGGKEEEEEEEESEYEEVIEV